MPERDVAKLARVQNAKDDCLREAGDLDGPDLIAREHFGSIAGIPDIHGEWPKPFCRTQSIRGLRIRAALKRQQPLDLVSLGKLNLLERQQNLHVFLDGLLAMEADNFAQADAGREIPRRILLFVQSCPMPASCSGDEMARRVTAGRGRSSHDTLRRPLLSDAGRTA